MFFFSVSISTPDVARPRTLSVKILTTLGFGLPGPLHRALRLEALLLELHEVVVDVHKLEVEVEVPGLEVELELLERARISCVAVFSGANVRFSTFASVFPFLTS